MSDAAPVVLDVDARGATLAEFESYLRLELGHAQQTVGTYLLECRQFLDWLARGREGRGPGEASANDVLDYLLGRKLEGLDERTIAKSLSSIRSFYRFLVSRGQVEANPADLIDTPRVARRVPRVFSLDEVERLLASIDDGTPAGIRDRALFELIYSCGLRVSEAADLTLERLNFREAAVLVTGKGSRERWVPLGEVAATWLRRYLDEARPKLAGSRPVAGVFLNQRGQGLSRKGMWKRFKEIGARAGVEGKIHTLRHSYATHLLQGGADLRSVQELLGHADIMTTQIYTHVGRDELHDYHHRFHPRG
jgi:integrase/recombinase XerD